MTLERKEVVTETEGTELFNIALEVAKFTAEEIIEGVPQISAYQMLTRSIIGSAGALAMLGNGQAAIESLDYARSRVLTMQATVAENPKEMDAFLTYLFGAIPEPEEERFPVPGPEAA